MDGQYNARSPAVKRLMREAKELRDPTYEYYAQPLEDNLFEWHFTVRGPPDSPYEGGIYHGRILFPPEYPMKPPSVILLTPNGRFELGKKICLSISAHHPETWQPSWSIRTVLVAIRSFMPTKGGGAIGALDYTPQERQALAKRSVNWSCSMCEMVNRDTLLDKEEEERDADRTKDEELAAQISFKSEAEVKAEVEKAKKQQQQQQTQETSSQSFNQSISQSEERSESEESLSPPPLPSPPTPPAPAPAARRRRPAATRRSDLSVDDSTRINDGHGNGRGLTILAWLLACLLLALLIRRVYRDTEDIPI
ncbi:ubiquitin-conjugating enzyme E2 J1-like [Oscarella lobularis]|uniref:ubiquitin-conjugating enzyme E2 J1-like n=1 Tax=Oscarella lobularis TaxID=121494 RepID=UPI0033132C7F